MATNNSSNNQYTNNADGYTLGGGTTTRNFTLTGGNVTLTGSGSNVYTMPAATDTLVGRASSDTLTNKTMTSSTNSVGPAARTGGFFIGTISASTVTNTTGNKPITGVGFTPKLVRFTAIPPASTGATEVAMGAMTASAQYYTSSASQNSSAIYARNSSTSACIGYVFAGSSTPAMLASYVSMDADGFTINVTTASNSYDIAFECYA